MDSAFQTDIAAIGQLAAVPTILDVVCRATGMGFAAIARVTGERWVACAVKDSIAFGLQPGAELQIETTICNEIRAHRDPVVISNVAEDPDYFDHPTPKLYGLQSYVSVPITLPDGTFFGTLCAIDPRPRHLDVPAVTGMMTLFAELVGVHLSTVLQLEKTQESLLAERKTSRLREEFIAVLGHDLRNPLAAVDAGMRLLGRTPLDAKAERVIGLVQQSVRRMAGLIDDVLDFARGRLGGGLPLLAVHDQPLTPVLTQIVAESRAAWPDRTVETAFDIAEPVPCDQRRLGQLLSNLLANALAYGAPDHPVLVLASVHAGRLSLSVTNHGDPIPPATRERLFQPFARGEVSPNQEGLGLGLYICAEIARAHRGDLSVLSEGGTTRFTFSMPLDARD